MADASLNIKIKTDAQQAKSSIDQLGKSLHNLQVPAASFGRTSGMLGNLGSVILGAGGLSGGVAGAMGASVKAFEDFQDAFASVTTMVDDAGDKLGGGDAKKGFEVLRKGLIDLSQESGGAGYTAENLAKVAAAGGQMNVPADRLMEFTSVVARSARITGSSTDQMAEGFGLLGNLFHSDDWTQMANVVVGLGKKNVLGVDNLLDAGIRLAPVLHTMGMDMPHILAIGAAFGDAGIQAEMGGSAIGRVFLNMQESVNAATMDIVGNTTDIRNAMEHVGDISDDLGIAQMQQGEMYNKRGKLKKQYRQHPSEVRAMDVRIKRLQREQGDAEQDLYDKQHPGQRQLGSFAELSGLSTTEFSDLFKNNPNELSEKFITGLGTHMKAGDLDPLLSKGGITNIRDVETLHAIAQNPQHYLDLINQANTQANAGPGEGALAEGTQSKIVDNPFLQQLIQKNRGTAYGIAIGGKIAPGLIEAEKAALDQVDKMLSEGKTVAAILAPAGGMWDTAIDGIKQFNVGLGDTVDLLGKASLGMVLLGAGPNAIGGMLKTIGVGGLSKLGIPGLILAGGLVGAETAHENNWFGTNASKQTGEAPNDVRIWRATPPATCRWTCFMQRRRYVAASEKAPTSACLRPVPAAARTEQHRGWMSVGSA